MQNDQLNMIGDITLDTRPFNNQSLPSRITWPTEYNYTGLSTPQNINISSAKGETKNYDIDLLKEEIKILKIQLKETKDLQNELTQTTSNLRSQTDVVKKNLTNLEKKQVSTFADLEKKQDVAMIRLKGETKTTLNYMVGIVTGVIVALTVLMIPLGVDYFKNNLDRYESLKEKISNVQMKVDLLDVKIQK